MRWPWVSRELLDAERERSFFMVDQYSQSLAAERQRLTDAYATINAMKLAGGSEPSPTMDKAEQDPISAAIYARAAKYPVRIRRQVIQAMSEDAMKRRAMQEDDESIIADIVSGITVDGSMRPE